MPLLMQGHTRIYSILAQQHHTGVSRVSARWIGVQRPQIRRRSDGKHVFRLCMFMNVYARAEASDSSRLLTDLPVHVR